VKIRALESKIICSFLQFSPRAGSWLSSTFVCPLKEDWYPTSFSCHVEDASQTLTQRMSVQVKVWQRGSHKASLFCETITCFAHVRSASSARLDR
jgi:hypothetical protein